MGGCDPVRWSSAIGGETKDPVYQPLKEATSSAGLLCRHDQDIRQIWHTIHQLFSQDGGRYLRQGYYSAFCHSRKHGSLVGLLDAQPSCKDIMSPTAVARRPVRLTVVLEIEWAVSLAGAVMDETVTWSESGTVHSLLATLKGQA